MPAAFGLMRCSRAGLADTGCFQGRRRGRRFFMGCSFRRHDRSMEHPGTGMRRTDILLPGITRTAACHHCCRHSIPWTTLAHGLKRTIDESATVPGGPGSLCLVAPRPATQFLDRCIVIPSRTPLARNLPQYRAFPVAVQRLYWRELEGATM